MVMKRHDDSQRSSRLAPQDRRPRRRPEGPRSGWPIPPIRSHLVGETDKLRAVRQPARPIPPLRRWWRRAPVASGGAGSVHRRTGRWAARALPGDRNGPGSPDPRLLLTAGKTHPRRCRSITYVARPTTPRCVLTQVPIIRRAIGVLHDGARTRIPSCVLASIAGPRQTASVRHLAGHPVAQNPKVRKREVQNDTQGTARARGVNPMSHTPRARTV